MFTNAYFSRYFGDRYFPPTGLVVVSPPSAEPEPSTGGGGSGGDRPRRFVYIRDPASLTVTWRARPAPAIAHSSAQGSLSWEVPASGEAVATSGHGASLAAWLVPTRGRPASQRPSALTALVAYDYNAERYWRAKWVATEAERRDIEELAILGIL